MPLCEQKYAANRLRRQELRIIPGSEAGPDHLKDPSLFSASGLQQEKRKGKPLYVTNNVYVWRNTVRSG